MNAQNLRIGTQLMLGFGVLLLLVVVLGTVSYIHNDRIHQQTVIMYDHPLKVRKAIGSLEFDILNMRLGTRDLMLAVTPQEKQNAIQLMELSAADALRQFKVLDEQYLGPRKDVEEAFKAFIRWKSAREENTRLALADEDEKVKQSVLPTGTVGIFREQMMAKIRIIDDFASTKADSLYNSSKALHSAMNRQLILLIVAILLLSLVVNYTLLRSILKPLSALTRAARSFHKGDMNARSSYRSGNEFGILSNSFNMLADSIQANTELDKKVAGFAGLMLSEYDAKKFFQSTMNELAAYTGSHMAAVYLLSADKQSFEHFLSTGLNDTARQSFSADQFEGEFGPVLSSRKVQHIKNISDDARFTFNTVNGTFIPHEIITLPIHADKEVIAVISLATISSYNAQTILLIETIFVTLCARVEGILAYHKMKGFSEKLERQNRELEAQKAEMASQAAELITQNSELEMQKNQLDEASRLKTVFLSNMSHELRTPLNSVIALSGVLNRRLANQIPDEEYSYLEVIERNGKLLLTLINDILDIARIEAGREEIEITQFNINDVVAEVVEMIQPQARQRNIELLHGDGDRVLHVISDAVKCRHILQNLIGNAVKFTEAGAVTISASRNNSTVEISVLDTGIGIDENHLPHIFDEFRQADGSTSRKFGGTGLGLAIAKKYAHLIGGTISVTSTPGKGSEFTLILPVHHTAERGETETETAAELKYAIRKAPQKPSPASPVKTILLVEDSEPAIIQLKDILEEKGHQVLIARNGSEALGIIALTIPDAMVLDLMMPGIDGFEVLKTIREAERTAHIPVLILTARHITKEELIDLKRNNIHQLIQKGDVNRRELQDAVASMVSAEPADRPEPTRRRQVVEGKPVVLVVEDNPDNMITVKAILADDYTVLEAVDGIEGVTMARAHTPHLILMDIALPGMDGIEAYKIIRNNSRLQHIPVIALTASAMISDRETILAHGFDAYIAKPIDERQFITAIRGALYGE